MAGVGVFVGGRGVAVAVGGLVGVAEGVWDGVSVAVGEEVGGLVARVVGVFVFDTVGAAVSSGNGVEVGVGTAVSTTITTCGVGVGTCSDALQATNERRATHKAAYNRQTGILFISDHFNLEGNKPDRNQLP
jgi:hypothetical protein